jgi:multiple sugar transport system permease protein
MTAIVVANLWVATPFVFMVLLAGLQGMPAEPIEAAIIDGTALLQRLWYVVLPMLRPAIRVVLLIRLADAIRIFDIVYILTGGGPGDSTQVFSTHIFRVSYGSLDLSQGAAGSFIMVFITAVISLIMARRFSSPRG